MPVAVTGFLSNGTSIFSSQSAVPSHPDLPKWLAYFRSETGQRTASCTRRSGDELTYLFAIRDGQTNGLLGVLALTARGALYQLPPHEIIGDKIAPLLTLITLHLTEGSKAVLSDREVHTMLVRTDKNAANATAMVPAVTRPAPRETMTLDQILAAAQRDTDSAIVVMFAAERGLIRFRSSGRFSTTDSALLKKIVSAHLAPAVQSRTTALVVNKMRDQGSGQMVPYRFLCVALMQGGVQIGTVVCVRRQDERTFTSANAAALDALQSALTQVVVDHTDDTTGLLTRAAFELEAQRLLALDERATHCAVHINVDRMHIVNDLFGFEVGNAILRNVGEAIRRQPMPSGGAACRLGGDQFAILLANCKVGDAQQWAVKLRELIATMPMPEACAGLEVTTSVGVAESEPDTRVEQTVSAAETATKAAKDRGRNRIELFTSNDVSLMQRHEDVAIFRKLVGALKAGEFQLFAQPIVSLVEPEPAPRFEILLRMLGRDGQIIPPRKFMSAATRYQLLPQLDRWVLSETLRLLSPHVAELSARDACFSVNLSGTTIAEPEFAQVVRKAIKGYEVPSSLVAFEITESAAIRSLDAAKRFINDLRALGCKFSLDDFGTGLSSLSYLKDLKVSTLKIDGSFIRDLAINPQSQTMVRAILEIARELQLETTAEFVETVDLASLVTSMGVTYAQGYAFGKPRPLTDVLKELLEGPKEDEAAWYSGQIAVVGDSGA